MKAQGLSLTTIVIAALVLIVLVVLVIIFGGQTRLFVGGVKSCVSAGGINDCFQDCRFETVNAKKPLKPGTTLVNIPGTNCEDNTQEKSCCKIIYGDFA